VAELTGQARRGAERRVAIVSAAIEVFAQQGFRSSGLAEVASKVGLTAPAILYHFGSKQALLLAVIEERDRRAGAELAELPIDGGLDSLRGIVRFAEQSEREPGLTALHTVLEAESFEPGAPAQEYFLARSRRLRRRTERWLLAAQTAGEVRADIDCAAKADELVAFLEGAAMVWLTDRSVSLVGLYRGYIDSLIESIRSNLNDQ
jgi:AcrR family transcriptional regulator